MLLVVQWRGTVRNQWNVAGCTMEVNSKKIKEMLLVIQWRLTVRNTENVAGYIMEGNSQESMECCWLYNKVTVINKGTVAGCTMEVNR